MVKAKTHLYEQVGLPHSRVVGWQQRGRQLGRELARNWLGSWPAGSHSSFIQPALHLHAWCTTATSYPHPPCTRLIAVLQDTRSYYDQCQALKGCTDRSIYDKPFPKPNVDASFQGPTAYTVPGVPVALCSVERPILAVYPSGMTPAKADFVSFCDTAANRCWVALQHTIALVSVLSMAEQCVCVCVS